jgi:uncharacterized membrane protein YdjX (TVP38/TMEM64 family)
MSGAAEGKPKSLLDRLAPLVLIAALLALAYALGLQKYFTLDALRDNRAALREFVDANFWLALLAFIALYALLVSLVFFPGAAILTVAGGLLFGYWGTPATVIGATIGATIVFLIARSALGGVLRDAAGSYVERFEEGFKQGEFSYMLVLRLVPAFPFWVVNIVPALLNASLTKYVLATAIGIIPGTFVFNSIGNAAGTAFDQGQEVTLTGQLTRTDVLIPIIGLAFLSLLPVVIRAIRTRKT